MHFFVKWVKILTLAKQIPLPDMHCHPSPLQAIIAAALVLLTFSCDNLPLAFLAGPCRHL